MTRLLRGLAGRLNPHRDASPPAPPASSAPAVVSACVPHADAPAAAPSPAHADTAPAPPRPSSATPSPVPAPASPPVGTTSHLAPPAAPSGTPTPTSTPTRKPSTRSSSFASTRRSPSPDTRRDNPLSTLVGHVGGHLSRTFGSGSGSAGATAGEDRSPGRKRTHRSRPSTAPAGPVPGERAVEAARTRSSSRPPSSGAADAPREPLVHQPSPSPDRASAAPEGNASALTQGSTQTRLSAWPEEDEPARLATAAPGQQQQQQQRQASVALAASEQALVSAQSEVAVPAPSTTAQPDREPPPACPPAEADPPAQPPDQANSNDAVATFRTGSLKEYDLFTLGPYEWLSDNVLAFWFELIEAQIQDRGSASASLWPPSVVELMSALPEDMPPDQARGLFPPLKSVVLLPVNDGYSSESAQAPDAEGGSHWSLIVITGADTGKKAKARHYDSMVPTNRESAGRVWERWCACFYPDLRMMPLEEAEELEPQENESDCGLYVLALAGLLLLDRSPQPVAANMAVRKVRAHDVERYRTHITDWLAKWRQYTPEQQAEWKVWDDVVRHVGAMPLLHV